MKEQDFEIMTPEVESSQNSEAMDIHGAGLDVFGSDEAMEAAFKQVERMAKFKNKVFALLASEINPERDIAKFGDGDKAVYRPSWSFADKVLGKLGGTFTFKKDDQGRPLVVKKEETDAKGKYLSIQCFGQFTSRFGVTVDVVQVVTSRHKLLGQKGGELRPMEDVNVADLVAAAYTMCYKKGVFRGYGIPMNMMPEDLQKFGVDVSKAGGHDFKKGNKGGSTDTKDDQDVRAAVETLCRALHQADYPDTDGNAFEKPEAILQAITANPEKGWDGWRSFRAVKAAQLPKILKKLQEVAEAYDDKMPL